MAAVGGQRTAGTIDRRKIALVSLAKTKVGMTDVEFRDLLAGLGCESRKDLTAETFRQVMAHFETLGFTSSARGRIRVPKEKRALMRKIGAQLASMKKPAAYADGIAKRMFGIERCEWCNPDQLLSVVSALAYRQKKEGADLG